MTQKFVHHVCIQTNTYVETLAFYTKALGFQIVEESLFLPNPICFLQDGRPFRFIESQ
ncbi:VOC family protein [Sporosarcina sp. Te-1]|uniref:VOC family protein n=1 Tax=Sporosarcina sp. Te-1 TaxID=2818390 RepID=UPI003530148C